MRVRQRCVKANYTIRNPRTMTNSEAELFPDGNSVYIKKNMRQSEVQDKQKLCAADVLI